MSLGKKILVLSVIFWFSHTGVLSAVNIPSGQLACANDTTQQLCYYMYRPPGGSAYKKYIGQPEVRWSYLTHGSLSGVEQGLAFNETAFPSSALSAYTTYNWNLGMHCGDVVGDRRNGKLYIIQPTAADGDPGSGSGNYSNSNVFPLYVPSISTTSLGAVVTTQHIHWLNAVDNVLGNTVEPYYVAPCIITKQLGTDNFFRLTGYIATDGIKSFKKSYIGTPELLDIWIMQSGYYLTLDISGYPSTQPSTLPPGLLIRTIANPTIYFTDDNGWKQKIQNQADFNILGFSPSQVTYLQQSTLDSTPTQTWSP